MDHPTTTTPAGLEPSRPAPAPKVAPPTPPSSSGRGWIWLLFFVALGVGVYYLWVSIREAQSTATSATAGKKGGKGGRGGTPGGVTPVVAAKAQKGNIGVYVTGLGAVTPIYTETVKSRVDGQLMQVLFKEGQLVHQGDLLVEIDPRPYQVQEAQAEGQLMHDQALLKNANVDLERYKVLFSQDAIPQQQLATQDALVDQYKGTVVTDQANIDSAKLNITYCHITAQITGIVGLRLVDPGNIVHASDSTGMLVITQIDPISVIFTAAEDQLPPVLQRVRAGQALPVEAWDRENKTKLASGALQTVDNQIDPTTGTLKLRAVFPNKNNALFPSQFVNSRMLVQEKSGVTVIPNSAIQRNSSTTYVWLIKPDQTVTVRNITLGSTEGENSEVVSGLEPGDMLVTVGVDKLQEGSKVTTQYSSGGRGRSKS